MQLSGELADIVLMIQQVPGDHRALDIMGWSGARGASALSQSGADFFSQAQVQDTCLMPRSAQNPILNLGQPGELLPDVDHPAALVGGRATLGALSPSRFGPHRTPRHHPPPRRSPACSVPLREGLCAW